MTGELFNSRLTTARLFFVGANFIFIKLSTVRLELNLKPWV